VPVHHAVLALLAGGPSYGYELRARFEESVGPQWGQWNIGHLYQVLDRLERERLVTKRVAPQQYRPDRVVYRLTKTGREEIDRWQLFAASILGEEELATVVRVQREAYLGELSALAKLRRQHRGDPLVSLLIEAAILHTKSDLRIVDLAEASSAELVGTLAGASGNSNEDAAAADAP
jgi:DNA-binding PadR family transcriptional regulator